MLYVVFNRSTKISDAEVEKMVPAFQTQYNQDLLPVWGLEKAEFQFLPKGQTMPAGARWIAFLDDSDQAGALAYHDLTNEGLPIAKVFVKTILEDHASVSVGASHEICEMAVDPWLDMAYQDMQGTFWAGEVCDPVEDDKYGYDIDGVLVSDFVTPNWFGHEHAKPPYDYKQNETVPFQILKGGYAQKFDPNSGWTQVTGSEARMRLVAVPGSRRERRVRGPMNWKQSNPTE